MSVVCVRVGYIGIDDGDNSDDASAPQHAVLGYYSSRHSQLVPFTALTSDLEALLPLFSASSRSEANKRCVRSALGCKCSISVTQHDHTTHTRLSLAKPAGKERWCYEKIRVPLCNTISAGLPTSSEPSARRPTPFGAVGSGERKITIGRKFLLLNVLTNRMTSQKLPK